MTGKGPYGYLVVTPHHSLLGWEICLRPFLLNYVTSEPCQDRIFLSIRKIIKWDTNKYLGDRCGQLVNDKH